MAPRSSLSEHAVSTLKTTMRYLLFGSLALAAAVSANAAKPDQLTGCIDEQPGPKYVLRGDQQLRLIAVLEPDGFPVQGFAKYLGHKVRLTGQLGADGSPPVMKVKTIKRISSYCAPQSSSGAGAPAMPSKLSGLKTETGCIDEQPGPRYVLRGDKELNLLMELEPEGFPVESFAKHLGHKVRVRGRTYSIDSRTVMRVTQIQQLSGVCAPAPR